MNEQTAGYVYLLIRGDWSDNVHDGIASRARGSDGGARTQPMQALDAWVIV